MIKRSYWHLPVIGWCFISLLMGNLHMWAVHRPSVAPIIEGAYAFIIWTAGTWKFARWLDDKAAEERRKRFERVTDEV